MATNSPVSHLNTTEILKTESERTPKTYHIKTWCKNLACTLLLLALPVALIWQKDCGWCWWAWLTVKGYTWVEIWFWKTTDMSINNYPHFPSDNDWGSNNDALTWSVHLWLMVTGRNEQHSWVWAYVIWQYNNLNTTRTPHVISAEGMTYWVGLSAKVWDILHLSADHTQWKIKVTTTSPTCPDWITIPSKLKTWSVKAWLWYKNLFLYAKRTRNQFNSNHFWIKKELINTKGLEAWVTFTWMLWRED